MIGDLYYCDIKTTCLQANCGTPKSAVRTAKPATAAELVADSTSKRRRFAGIFVTSAAKSRSSLVPTARTRRNRGRTCGDTSCISIRRYCDICYL
ncbi:hypothetical protein J6590_014735 [Homalodisca vitripennis]|nr:hypothetical protein J6590_014735 [Homalodisca vitripennis]